MDNTAAENAIPPPSKQGSEGANSRPKPASNVLAATPVVAEGATNEQRTLASEPMTASTSTSSLLSIKDPEIAAPYGTRSTRNRGAASRPNYAEDREIEMDFEYTSAKDTDTKKKAQQQTDTAMPSDQSQHNGRKAGGEVLFNGTTTMSKEHIPGTSTFSANPSPSGPPPSKKRKAVPGPAAIPAGVPIAQNGIAHGNTTTRGAYVAAQASSGIRDTNMLSFDNCGARLKNGKLVADDGTILEVNDHVYLICEPPGEPYYLGRIMEFLHTNNDTNLPIDSLRMNWYYRPKDIGRSVTDTRQVFASMHSDTSPLASLRGKCTIKHRSEIQNLDDLRKQKDCFWYDKLFDRYIRRYYEVIPTSQVVNVPVKVKKVLDERWKYILVEAGRGKELTSAVKSCKRCSGYCASNDSVDCAVCHQTYHMNCVRPPLLKKPSRGFAWACGPCSRAHERTLEARNTPNTASIEGDDDEILDDEEDDGLVACNGIDTGKTSPAPSENTDLSVHPGTAEQIHQASLWPFRYLGVHCKVEDALDYDDRIYPRAISRLGPRHQAIVSPWPGRPLELVKPTEIKKKYVKPGNHKKDSKLSKETIAALEADKLARESRPKWVVDEPVGYVHRGESHENNSPDCTATLLFRLPEVGESSSLPSRGGDDDVEAISYKDFENERLLEQYMSQAKPIARQIGVPDYSTNFMDKAVNLFYTHNYDIENALKALRMVDKKGLKEPELSAAEIKKFEDGVTKFGSELHSVKKHVKTVFYGDIVRFYYIWKKTERGKQIWGNYGSRKNKKEAKEAKKTAMADIGKLQDDVADDHDDSAFDNDKIWEKKRQFQCKFCSTRTSRQWRRAPNTVAGTMTTAEGKGKDKGTQYVLALCRRCAELWRRYAIQWEDIDEVAKKVAAAGGRAWKRRIDNELLEELQAANEVANIGPADVVMPNGALLAPGLVQPPILQAGLEPPRKKQKGSAEKDMVESSAMDAGGPAPPVPQKKKPVEKPAPPPPPPPPPVKIRPKPKIMPCAVCFQMEPLGDQHVSCKECRMTVHRNCYGIVGETRGVKWVCDSCSNDKNPQVSIDYKCILCSHEETKHDFIEPPKLSHKKKTEKDRERERVEMEDAKEAAAYYEEKQRETNRPVNPREPLKRTANNNWIHVTCAVWTPEIKFGNAKAMEPSEGIPSIPLSRYDDVCKICKRGEAGACVSCHQCKATFHVECAHQVGHVLGFDIAPVKGSRRDHTNIVNINGETGLMTAAIWCKEHAPTKTIVHRMHDVVNDDGLNALQLYVQNFKQADLTLTGTVRKANLVSQSTKAVAAPSAPAPNRRVSLTATINGHGRTSTVHIKEDETDGSSAEEAAAKSCVTCGNDVSPKWWSLPPTPPLSIQPVEPVVPVEPVPKKEPTPLNADEPRLMEDVPMPQVSTSNEAEPPTVNGHASENDHPASYGNQIALAVAALQAPIIPAPTVMQYQCHKCHFKKIPIKEPTPPPAPVLVVAPEPQPEHEPEPLSAPPEPVPEAAREPQPQPEPESADKPEPSPPAVPVMPQAPPEPVVNSVLYPTQPIPRYTSPWPPTIQPPTTHNSPYSPPGPYNEWPRQPTQMTQASPNIQPVHRYASPLNASAQQPTAPAHPLSNQPMVPSPQQNGLVNQQPNSQAPAYSPPPPPHHHRTHSNSSGGMSNGAFPSYVSSRPPPPQHLTNGGPPPRAPENPFPQLSHVQNHNHNQNQNHHGPFGMSHNNSPQMPRDGPPPSRDSNNGNGNLNGNGNNGQANGAHPGDGRVNGGASASPSLRNLLS